MVFELQRASDGSITESGASAPLPTLPAGYSYCPWFAAADPTDHVAIAVQPMHANGSVAGPYQLATYTADSSGNLTTTSTFQNMPSVRVGGVSDYWMSPGVSFQWRESDYAIHRAAYEQCGVADLLG